MRRRADFVGSATISRAETEAALTWAEGMEEAVTFATFDRQLWKGSVRHAPVTPCPEDLSALLDEWA